MYLLSRKGTSNKNLSIHSWWISIDDYEWFDGSIHQPCVDDGSLAKKMVHASIGETRISLQILAHDELVFKVCGTCYNIWSASLDFGFIWICLNKISYGPHASIVIPHVEATQPTHAIQNIQTNERDLEVWYYLEVFQLKY
jgi:hypothetical protein